MLIYLHIPTIFWRSGRAIVSYCMRADWTGFRQTDVLSSPLAGLPWSGAFVTEQWQWEVELVLTELLQNPRKVISSAVSALIDSVRNNEKVLRQFMVPILKRFIKKNDKTVCNSYGNLKPLSRTHNPRQISSFPINSIYRGNYWRLLA
jgi:hypothetical protein